MITLLRKSCDIIIQIQTHIDGKCVDEVWCCGVVVWCCAWMTTCVVLWYGFVVLRVDEFWCCGVVVNLLRQ